MRSGAERLTSPQRGIESGHRSTTSRQPVVPGSIDTDNQRTWETVKCRAEVGGGRSSDDDRDNITRSERRASSQVCEVTSDECGIAERLSTHSPLGQVYELEATLGSPANAGGTAECRRSTAWGRAVCGRTACTVRGRGDWGGRDPGEMDHMHPAGNQRD